MPETNPGQMVKSTYAQIDNLPDEVAALSTALQTEGKTREDEDLLIEDALGMLIDTIGWKNIFTTTAATQTISGVTFTNNGDGTWLVNGSASARAQKQLAFSVPAGLPSGRYVLSGCPDGGADHGAIQYCLYIWDATAGARVIPDNKNDTGDGAAFDWVPDSTHSYILNVDVRSGAVTDNLIFKPMICLEAYWKITKKFVPNQSQETRSAPLMQVSPVVESEEMGGNLR